MAARPCHSSRSRDCGSRQKLGVCDHPLSEKKNAEAIAAQTHLITLMPDNPKAFYNLACIYALANKKKEAVAALKKAVDKGYDRWHYIKNDPDLKNIQDTDYFKNLARQQE